MHKMKCKKTRSERPLGQTIVIAGLRFRSEQPHVLKKFFWLLWRRVGRRARVEAGRPVGRLLCVQVKDNNDPKQSGS